MILSAVLSAAVVRSAAKGSGCGVASPSALWVAGRTAASRRSVAVATWAVVASLRGGVGWADSTPGEAISALMSRSSSTHVCSSAAT